MPPDPGLLNAFDKLGHIQPTYLFSHDDDCCALARSWLFGMHSSYLALVGANTMPIWLREHYRWGPVSHPIYWCEVSISKVLDCGALSALSRECLLKQGITAIPAQLMIMANAVSCDSWSRIWHKKNSVCNWIYSPFIYHEVCAVVRDAATKTIELWDPTENCWIEPGQSIGYMSPVAIRVFETNSRELRWKNITLEANKWKIL